ncbi:MAG: hypothetical protein AAF564_26445 [Bacteroidota bacterium]
MGKGIAVVVVATLLFVMMKQSATSEAQTQTEETKVDYQEDYIAQEIAMSAFSIAERRVEKIGGPRDSVLAAFDAFNGSAYDASGVDTGDFQGGSYEIRAFPMGATDGDMVKLEIKGMYGDASHVMEKTFFTYADPVSSWEYSCGSTSGANFVEIQGVGMGDNGTLLNNGATIALTDTTQIRFLKAQVGGRTNRIDDVTFTTVAGQDTTLEDPTASGDHSMGYFETPLTPTSGISVDVDTGSGNGARGFVVYAHRRIPGAHFSEGRYLDMRMYHYGHTETFQIPAATSPRTVYVDYVMYDKDDDGRTVTMTIDTGMDQETRTIGLPNKDRELSIETVAIHNVDGSVTEIDVEIYTNDSLYWKMAHVYTAGCN